MSENRFELEVEWLDLHGICGPESEFFCELTIRLDGKALTANVDQEGRRRDYIRVSALPLARWLCNSFWRILYEPGSVPGHEVPLSWNMAHLMASVGDGYAWPNVRFDSDGKKILIKAESQSADQARIQRIRFLADAEARLGVQEAGDGIMRFLHKVRDRARNIGNGGIVEMINQLEDELADPEIADYRILEAMLGYDPGEAPESFMEKFRALSETMTMGELYCLADWLNPVHGGERCNHLERMRFTFQEKEGVE